MHCLRARRSSSRPSTLPLLPSLTPTGDRRILFPGFFAVRPYRRSAWSSVYAYTRVQKRDSLDRQTDHVPGRLGAHRDITLETSFCARETSDDSGRLRAVELCKTPELSLRNLLLLFWATTTISPRRLSRRGSNKPWRIVRSPLWGSAKDSGRMERECGADAPIEQITAGGFGSATTSAAHQPYSSRPRRGQGTGSPMVPGGVGGGPSGPLRPS